MDDTERQQLIQDYLDGHASRGGLITDEIRRQAEQYATRIAESRAYEDRLKAHAAEQRKLAEYATTDHALRARSDRKRIIAEYLNRFGDENTAITPAMREQAARYAERVLAAADPVIAQQAVKTAQQRLADNQARRAASIAQLRADLAARCGSNHWRAIREQANALRHALDGLDTQLFQEAMRPETPQGSPEEPGTGSDAPASVATTTIGRAIRHSRRQRT